MKNNPENHLNLLKSFLRINNRTELSKAYRKSNGNWEKTRKLLKKSSLTNYAINKLDFVYFLSNITGCNEKFTRKLFTISSTKDKHKFAYRFDAKLFMKIIEKEDIPASMTKESEEDIKNNYIENILNKLLALETSAVIQRMIDRNEIPSSDETSKKNLNELFNKQPEFDLKKSYISELLRRPIIKKLTNKEKQNVANELKKIQRVFTLSPNFASSTHLLKGGINSAEDIAGRKKQEFLSPSDEKKRKKKNNGKK